MLRSSPRGLYVVGTKFVFILLTSLACFGQKTYDIHRAASPINIDGKLDERDWLQAPSVGDFHFPWFKEGMDDNLYVS